jgi:histidinol phosphatase-like enzyme
MISEESPAAELHTVFPAACEEAQDWINSQTGTAGELLDTYLADPSLPTAWAVRILCEHANISPDLLAKVSERIQDPMTAYLLEKKVAGTEAALNLQAKFQAKFQGKLRGIS